MASILKLREERADLVKKARQIQDRAEKEGRSMTSEEEAQFDRFMDEVDRRGKEIAREERVAAAESEGEEPVERRGAPIESDDRDAVEEETPKQKAEQRAAYRRYLRTGEVPQPLRLVQERARRREFRDTIISTDAKGGFLVTPVEISSDIVKLIDDFVYIRQLCMAAGSITTVVDAKSLGIRKRSVRMADANWTTEVAGVTEDTTGAYDRRDLTPNLLTKLALVSIRTLQIASDAEKEVNDELAYKFGITEEKGYLLGTGSGQPMGIFTAGSNGISTARDVAAASTTVVAGDDLVNVKYSIKQAYLKGPGVSWAFSRTLAKNLRKLKVASTTGGNDLEYLWQPGLAGGTPDTVLDLPYFVSEYVPNTFTTGLYVAALGNFRYYRIAQVADLVIQRLVERYADTNQVGFIGRRWVDGAPVVEEAFARLKLA